MRTIEKFVIENKGGLPTDTNIFGITNDGEKIKIGYIQDYTIFQSISKVLPELTLNTLNFKIDMNLDHFEKITNKS